jgi:hypothetical protein
MKIARFLPEIFEDLSAAARDYDRAGGKDLEDRFIQSFYSCVNRSSGSPEAHRKVFGEVRRILLQPFPYKLYFRVTESEIVFSLLIHAARDERIARRLLQARARKST